MKDQTSHTQAGWLIAASTSRGFYEMRSRNIKPGFFKNELLGVSDPLLSIIFVGLWCAADREGRLEDRPLRLKAELLPYRENIDFNVYLTELERLGFVRRYTSDGVKVIEVINFKKHQNPHKTERDSELPEFSDSCCLTVKDTLSDGEVTEAARLIPDSLLLIPDVLIPDCHVTVKPPKNTRATKISKDFSVTEEMEEWAKSKAGFVGDIDRETSNFIDYWLGEGKSKADWEATWRNWIKKAIEIKGKKEQKQVPSYPCAANNYGQSKVCR